ncbi:MAG: hypothetical protein NTY83_00510, partial [Candidatus Micrarchaeota archaeon]|nr:hypothetical protein [Candidatus Micrarchaeota archaeon]
EEELLPLEVEMAARRTAAVLIAKAGERAVEHFSRITSDAAINDGVRREAVAASVSVGDKMLEAQVMDAGSKGIREKYMAVNAVLHSDALFGEPIRAMYLANPDWHNAMLADGLDRGSQIPEWKKQIMKWVIVQGVVLHRRPEAANIAHSLCEYYRFFKPEELAGDLREAIYSKAKHEGLLPDQEIELAMRSIELFSRAGLDTKLLEKEVLRPPARPAEDCVDRAKYQGLVRSKARTPPPLPRRGDSGARKLVGPNGNNGGAQ